jgi:cytochrome d ubiquinol oxidase subunit I
MTIYINVKCRGVIRIAELAFLGTDPLRQREDDRVSVLDLSRWQFSVTTVYRFLFVPIAVGIESLVAGFVTAWVGAVHERRPRVSKSDDRLFLIGSASGDVTGIAVESGPGTNWFAYSRMAGPGLRVPVL